MKLKDILSILPAGKKVHISGYVYDPPGGELPIREYELIINDAAQAIQELPRLLLDCTPYYISYSDYHSELCVYITSNARTGSADLQQAAGARPDDPDVHSCSANADASGCCDICGALVYGSSAYCEAHGCDPPEPFDYPGYDKY